MIAISFFLAHLTTNRSVELGSTLKVLFLTFYARPLSNVGILADNMTFSLALPITGQGNHMEILALQSDI